MGAESEQTGTRAAGRGWGRAEAEPGERRARWPARVLVASLGVVAAALLVAPLRGHVDDTDAQHYQVLARGLAAQHRWTSPQPDPDSVRPFHEHLPFALWPQTAAVRAFGEGALPLPGALFSLGVVALVLLLGARLGGLRAGFAAALVLCTCESFFAYGARPRLDPALLFFSLASAAPFLASQRLDARRAAWAAAAAALAVLVKGPFGLVPLCAAALARALVDRRLRPLALGAGAAALALAPAALFLAHDALHGGGYVQGYLREQVLASASGARTDGSVSALFPLQSVAARFWPGLPLALLAVLLAATPAGARKLQQRAALREDEDQGEGEGESASRERRTLRLAVLAAAVALALLSLPARKVWNHELVAYPLLALCAGLAAARLLARVSLRKLALCGAGLAALAVLLSASGALARVLLRPPCAPSRELRTAFAGVPPGTRILVVASPRAWGLVESLAAEQRLSPWALTELPRTEAAAQPAAASQEAQAAPEARAARTREEEISLARLAIFLPPAESDPTPSPWRELARARGLRLLAR